MHNPGKRLLFSKRKDMQSTRQVGTQTTPEHDSSLYRTSTQGHDNETRQQCPLSCASQTIPINAPENNTLGRFTAKSSAMWLDHDFFYIQTSCLFKAKQLSYGVKNGKKKL